MSRTKTKEVVVIGTYHPFQRGTHKKDEFESYLLSVVNSYKIQLIGEEIDDMPEVHPVAKDVAQKLKIDYRIIEPTEKEKTRLGIETIDDINKEFCTRHHEIPCDDIPKSLPYDERVHYDERYNKALRQRESEWLRRLESYDRWPALVICGSEHFKDFCKLLTDSSITPIAENSYWGEEWVNEIESQGD